MKNALLLVGLVISLVPNLFAQTENTAPVVWERYRYSDLDVSVNLPKLPNVATYHDPCTEVLERSGYAYAEGAVYELKIVASVAPKVRPYKCSTSKSVLDQSTLARRLDELRQAKGVVETKTRVADSDSYQFNQERSVRVIIPDIGRQRWIELAINHYPNENPATDRYFRSLQFEGESGQEIGEGAKATLGDPATKAPVVEAPEAPAPTQKLDTPSTDKPLAAGSGNGGGTNLVVVKEMVPLHIVSKPAARYTDAARDHNVQGTVRLKATLLHNGTVGSVTALTPLEHGLTEQAIFAARRLVFLPARLNGVPFSKTITIDYSFSIY